VVGAGQPDNTSCIRI